MASNSVIVWIPFFLLCVWAGYVTSKTVPFDPQEGLVCFNNRSLTRSDTDGTKHTQPVQPWQQMLDHAPCFNHLTCDAAVNGVHVLTSRDTSYAIPGHGAVFVVTLESDITDLSLTIDLRAKDCILSKLTECADGFVVECKMNSDSVQLILALYSGGKWNEDDYDIDTTKGVNQGVSAVLEVRAERWYFFAQEDHLCNYDLSRRLLLCSAVAQGKCHYVAAILPIPGQNYLLIACSAAAGSQHKDYVALYSTDSAEVEKHNFPTGEFMAVHLSSSGNFTAFVSATFITVVRTLDSSSSAQQREIPVTGQIVFSLVSGEVLVYTTTERAPAGVVTYRTFALHLAKAFHSGTAAELLEGDNCTVTESPAPNEWIVACSNAMYWYRGDTSDSRVHISWLDGSANKQRCFTGNALLEPTTAPPPPRPPTAPPVCDTALAEAKLWKTAAIVTTVIAMIAVVVILGLVVLILVLCRKLHNQQVKSTEPPTQPNQEPGPPPSNPEEVELLDSRQRHKHPTPHLQRRSSTQSTPSTIPRHHSSPTLNEMMRPSLTSLDGIPASYGQPQSSGHASRPTHTGNLDSFSASSIASSFPSVQNTPHDSMSRISTSGPEEDEPPPPPPPLMGGTLSSDATNVTDSGGVVASPQDLTGESELTVELPTQSRALFTYGNGATSSPT